MTTEDNFVFLHDIEMRSIFRYCFTGAYPLYTSKMCFVELVTYVLMKRQKETTHDTR